MWQHEINAEAKSKEQKMTIEKQQRINELAKLSKERALTAEEAAEQKTLREEYIAEFRANLRGQLDNTYIKEQDGTIHKAGKRG